MITSDRAPWTPEALQRTRSQAYANGVGTHIPLLAACIAKASRGPVVEAGVGHASSPLIAEMCRANGREYYACDSDEYWRESTLDLGSIDAIPGHPAVAFVDSIGTMRLDLVRRFRDVAQYIVIHDTDNQSGDLNELLAYLDTFTYRYDYKVMRPWTTVVSMMRPYP